MTIFETVQKIRESILRYLSPEPVAVVGDGFRSMVMQAMPSCPVCGLTMAGHRYQRIASTPIKLGNDEKLNVLLEAVRLHQWGDLADLQDWEPLEANADVVLFQCADGRFNLTVIYDPFELYDVISLLRHEEIKLGSLPVTLSEWKEV